MKSNLATHLIEWYEHAPHSSCAILIREVVRTLENRRTSFFQCEFAPDGDNWFSSLGAHAHSILTSKCSRRHYDISVWLAVVDRWRSRTFCSNFGIDKTFRCETCQREFLYDHNNFCNQTIAGIHNSLWIRLLICIELQSSPITIQKLYAEGGREKE